MLLERSFLRMFVKSLVPKVASVHPLCMGVPLRGRRNLDNVVYRHAAHFLLGRHAAAGVRRDGTTEGTESTETFRIPPRASCKFASPSCHGWVVRRRERAQGQKRTRPNAREWNRAGWEKPKLGMPAVLWNTEHASPHEPPSTAHIVVVVAKERQHQPLV